MRRDWANFRYGAIFGFAACLALTGCATTKTNVVRQLPSPIVTTKSQPKVAPPKIRPRVKSKPAPTRTARANRDWVPKSGIKNRWNYIVVHHSATEVGNAAGFDFHHRNVNKWDELGYHFVIGNGTRSGNGLVEVGPRWKKQKVGAHCKTVGNTYNEHGIGICLVGDFDKQGPTDAQMRSLVRLVRFLMFSCSVTPGNVVTHSGVTGKTECPGANFPWSRFHRQISEPASAGVMR